MKNNTIRGFIFAILAGTCWGFSGTVGQYLMSQKGLDSGWITVPRLIGSGVLLFLISFIRSKNTGSDIFAIWKNKQDRIHLLIFGIFGLMAVQFAYMQAIRYSNAGTATAIQYAGEIWILFYTCISLRKKPKQVEVFGLILALSGIFLLATHGDIHNLALTPNGILWGLIASVTLAIYTIIPGELTKRYDSITVVAYGMFIGGIVLFFLLRFWSMEVSLDKSSVFGMALIILIGTALAFSSFMESIRLIGPLKAGLVASIETVAAPFFSRVWLHTDFIWIDYVGFLFILIMVILLALPELMANKKTAK